jgi:hypothetical protein
LRVVLLVEDAQYADAGLLDFLEHLIDWARDLPIYVLVFARPDFSQARPGFGTGRNRSTPTLDQTDRGRHWNSAVCSRWERASRTSTRQPPHPVSGDAADAGISPR